MNYDLLDVECAPIQLTEAADAASIRPQARMPIGRVSLPSDPSWQCPPIRLSGCPTCGVAPGVQCVGIDRNDEVHVDRVWQGLAG